MKICREVGFYELKNHSWSGAIDTLNRIEEEGKEDELMDFLELWFADAETPTDTEVNDFLWFEDEFIFKALGIEDEEEEEDEESEEE